jgi:very-short-patch-repair endonuclease
MTAKVLIPRTGSQGEEEFAWHCKLELPEHDQPEREFRFDSVRGWRLDFAWPRRKLAVEIESSVHRIKGRFATDLDKYNALQLDGWMLLRYTAKMVHSAQAIDTVKKILCR